MKDYRMDHINHSSVDVGGLSLHVAQIGSGELGSVLFLHGFPEIWYSWRHQMVAVANAGYRAIAPDFRGYGLSEQPAGFENGVQWSDLVKDTISILDYLAIPKVFVVAKDFGCKPAFMITLQYPKKVCGLITLGVPFSPHKFVPSLLPEGFYILRWRQPERAEADFGRFDVKTVIRNIYILFSGSELPIAREDEEVMDMVGPDTSLPHWFSDEDLAAYTNLYEKSGFRFPLQMPYRASYDQYETDSKIQVPALLIMGEKDYFFKFPGIEDYSKSEAVKNYVPDLEVKFIPEGSHFVQEQFPDEVNETLIRFLNNHA